MKRLLAIAIIIGIIAYIAVQFLKDRRFNVPSDYDFEISQNIDKDFYDPSVLKEYYGTVLEVGTFARSMWRTYTFDVRSPDADNPEEVLKSDYYNQLRETALFLQDKLEKSKVYKEQGYTNPEIKLIMEQGLTPEDLRLRENAHMFGLSRGSSGSAVWELQKMLNALGDSIPEDGIFNLITTNRLREFQSQNNLFPSGEVDEKTLKALLK